MKRRFIASILAMVLVLSMVPLANAATHPFTDVTEDSWYAENVEYVYVNGFMTGTSSTTFNPNGTMTRAMVVCVLYRLVGCPDVSGVTHTFTDVVADSWYEDAVCWAVSTGVTSGTSATTFSPNNSVTREQLVTFAYRMAESAGYAMNTTDISGYADYDSVSDYAKPAFAWSVANGIVNGVSATTLAPKGTATRAQCAAIVQRINTWMETATGENGEEIHSHNYIAAVTAPTCTEQGYTTFTCECGQSYIGNYTEAVGHSYVTETVEATTTTQGYDIHTCTVCGHSCQDNFTGMLPDNSGGYSCAEAMAAGNAYAAELGFTVKELDKATSGYRMTTSISPEYLAELGGQEYMNARAEESVQALADWIRSQDGEDYDLSLYYVWSLVEWDEAEGEYIFYTLYG